jgi:quinol monooxygenase YgiN
MPVPHANEEFPMDSIDRSHPPAVAAPQNARPVLITLRLSAKDAAALQAHLLNVIPVTRLASGCRASRTYQAREQPSEFLLVQAWDSTEQQAAYLRWRDATGALAEFLAHLKSPPMIETFELIDG